MMPKIALAGLLALLAPAAAMADSGGGDGAGAAAFATPSITIPAQLDADQRAGYRAVFAAIHAGRWADAALQLDAMKPGPLHAIARAELYTAKDSPRVDADQLSKLLADAPELPEAATLYRLAKTRGAVELPPLPEANPLTGTAAAPTRRRARPTLSDAVATSLALRMQPFVKADDGVNAEALLNAAPGLSPEAATEWQQRTGWIYYIAGQDADARRMAAKAETGSGEWAVQAFWLDGLAAWRTRDYASAETAFTGVAARANDTDLRAAALYWSARASMAAGHPEKVQRELLGAAQYRETFYGLLAREALGMRDRLVPEDRAAAGGDWDTLQRRPNVRVAAALTEIDEDDLASDVLDQQARIGDPREYGALLRLAAALKLPEAQIWLAHNRPAGANAPVMARYPAPAWTPEGGWRVDKALVYAHALQESGFRRSVVSHAGAYGLMQIMPAAATDYARGRGLGTVDRSALTDPAMNIAVGQTTLERLRDQGCTGGLLPKVIAAYNAGPLPVTMWNAQSRDGGDPLLYIESIPYWETRGYVVTVMRNYWMYEAEGGRTVSPSRNALAQGMWPRFPGQPGPAAVKLRTSIAPPLPKQVVLPPPAPVQPVPFQLDPLPAPGSQPAVTYATSVD